MIDGDSCMVYVVCPLRPTRLRLALFATTVLQRPAPRFRPSSLRSPRGTRFRPSSPQAPLWSLQTSQLESHELDEYCTPRRFVTVHFGVKYVTLVHRRVIYGILAYLSEARINTLRVTHSFLFLLFLDFALIVLV